MILSTHGIIGSSGAVVAPASTGLYAVYKAENNANDSLGVLNGTAVGGVTYTTGINGNAFNLNGTTGLISLPNGALSSLGTSFSYNVWVYINQYNGNGICAIFNTYTDSGGNRGFYTRVGSQTLQTYAFNSSGTAIINGAGGGAIPVLTWKMVTITFDGSNVRSYVNGSIVDTTAYSGTIAYGATTYPSFGALHYDTATYAYFLQGKIDEVNIWNKKLSNAEVTDLYNSGTGKFYPTF